jgi:hypothetical protein
MRYLFSVLIAFLVVAVATPLEAATVHAGAAALTHPSLTVFSVLAGGLALGTLLSAVNPTLLDVAKRTDPNGKIQDIAELLTQLNEVLDDATFMECNDGTTNLSTIRTGLPTVYWRTLNAGVPPSKSTTAQVREGCGMLEGWSEVDRDLARMSGDIGAFRLSESIAFLEAMNQEMASTLFYGNAGLAPEEFTGLSTRYSLSTAGNGSNVVKAGSSDTDNTSMWLIVWGPQTVSCLFPKGSKAGLSHEDRDEQLIQSATGLGASRMIALVDHFKWDNGLNVKDWRFAVRICNIDVSLLVANGGSQALLLNFMAKAVHRIPSFKMGRAAFYCNRTVAEFLDIQEKAAVGTGGGLNYDNVDGRKVLTFRGIPIRTVDALLETEALVS